MITTLSDLSVLSSALRALSPNDVIVYGKARIVPAVQGGFWVEFNGAVRSIDAGRNAHKRIRKIIDTSPATPADN